MNKDEHQIKVLLVDDEIEFLTSTAKALERRGFDIITAVNGTEAQQALWNHYDIKVAVLDVKMPDIDGHELFYLIKARWPDIRVIVLTGHGDVSRAFELAKKGVFDYLGKPCEIDVLAEKIRSAYHTSEDKPDTTRNSTKEQPVGETIRVLLVDDEEEFLYSMERTLSRRGLSITLAKDGKVALKLLGERPFDVAVVDIKMPGIDGVDLLSRIKDEKPLIEVILLTGHGSVDTARAGLKKGAFDYLLKPQDVDDLSDKIRDAAENKQKAEKELQKKKIDNLIKGSPS